MYLGTMVQLGIKFISIVGLLALAILLLVCGYLSICLPIFNTILCLIPANTGYPFVYPVQHCGLHLPRFMISSTRTDVVESPLRCSKKQCRRS